MSSASNASTAPAARARLAAWAIDAGGILSAWLLFLALENVVVARGYGELFAGTWEMAAARWSLTPIALATLLPLALVLAALPALVTRRRVLATLVAAAGALTAFGVSTGRHMASWAVRGPFIAGVAGIAFALAWWGAPFVVRQARAGAWRIALAGAVLAPLAWMLDAFVLPRLYPAFHAALFGLALVSAACVSLAWVHARAVGVAMLALGIGCVAWTPHAARKVRSLDNLRIVLVEHAPLLGRAVRIAAVLAPPPPLDDPADVGTRTGTGAPAAVRALEWSGRDVLLLSVDALRADHVSAYGYGRATTPHLDALAREGALFESAYCPTPHTSYSVTSMMTGKYMRPLLALGLAEHSETWAADLRRYDYRTAAFYPPAVFFIDGPRFTDFEKDRLGFEYAKVEFAGPALREAQVAEYLRSSPAGRPLFLWAHLFEPHEPYVMHPEHLFGPAEGWSGLDAYDSEIAAADAGVGAIVARVRAARPGVVVIVTADHGEEFGEHGGRYHGTTVYEEQVRVPLIIVGPGVAPRMIAAPVQTIDLLPTVLSALGIPRPPRVRGRDLGTLLTARASESDPAAPDPGLAFAETDDMTMLARGADRLICLRQAGACALYDVKADPTEQHNVATSKPGVTTEMRRATVAVEREHGRFEAGDASGMPEALRRGVQGDVETAVDVAQLLDDAKVTVRREAAQVSYGLHAPAVKAQLTRALARDEDEEVRRFCALALVRIGEKPSPLGEKLLGDPDPEWRRRAALAFAEQGDARGEGELVAWFESGPEFARARELLLAIGKIRARSAVPALAHALIDVRLRPFVADALGAIGSPTAREPLATALARERYVTARPHEARALLLLGARAELRAPLMRFSGIPEPMPEAIVIARDAGLLEPETGGWASSTNAPSVDTRLALPKTTRALRLVILLATPGSPTTTTSGTIDGRAVAFVPVSATVRIAEIVPSERPTSTAVTLHLEDVGGLLGAWIVPRADDVAPPAPEDANDAGIQLR